MLLSLLPTVVFAAGDTHAAKIELVKTSEKTYNGVDVMRLDLYIKAEKIVGSPLAMVKYDTSKLTLIKKNAEVISSDDISTALPKTAFVYVYKNADEESFTQYAYAHTTEGTLIIAPEWDGATETTDFAADLTKIVSFYFGIADTANFGWDNLPSNCIRFATATEADAASQNAVVVLPYQGGAYHWRDADGKPDTFTTTPTLASDGSFTFTKPALPPYPGTIDAPTVNSNAGGKVVLDAAVLTPADPAAKIQYGYSNSASTVPTTWQDSTTFTGLTPGSTYYFYAKVVESATYKELVSAATSVTVASKAVPTINTVPTAAAITYGQKLSNSNLTGGEAEVGGTAISGTFAWKTPSTAPEVKDSNSTEYEVVFTPSDVASYETATCKVKLTVNPKSLTDVAVEDIAAQTYTGSQITPAVEVKGDGGKKLVKDKDYTVDYGANNTTGTGAGTVTVKAKSGGNYSFAEVVKTFDIQAGSADDTLKGNLKATHTPYTGTYNGTAHNAFTADMSSVTGWTATYSRTETGTYGSMPTVENVADSGNIYVKFSHASYADVIAEYEVKITQKSISDMLVTLDHDSFVYDGTDKTVAVTSVKTTDGAVTLTPTSDYTIDSGSSTMTAKNVPEGAGYPVVVAGTGNYTGTHTVYWKITKADPNAADFDILGSSAPLDYTGDPISVTPPTLKSGKTDAGAVTVYYKGASGTTYSKDTNPPTEVGTYDVTFDVAGGKNFKAASDLIYGTLTIKAKNVSDTRSAENQTVVKDVGDFTPPTFGAVTGTLTYTYDGGTKTYEDIKAALAAKNAGETATIDYSYAANGNYTGTITGRINVTVVDVTFDIQADAITVATDPTYGSKWSQIVSFDASKITAKVGSDTCVAPTYTLKDADTVPNSGSQTYTITFSGAINGVNYTNVTVKSDSVSIDKATVTVAPGTYKVSKAYDGTTTAGTGNGALAVSGILPADSGVTVTPTIGAYSNADVGTGNVNVSLSINGDTNSNYQLGASTVSVPCKITPATLTVDGTASATAGYGTALKDITITGLTAKLNGTDVAGSWAFSGEASLDADNTTAYTATFTPSTGAGNYNALTASIVPTINKIAYTGSAITATKNVLTNTAVNGVEVDMTSLLTGIKGAAVSAASELSDIDNIISNVSKDGNKVKFDVASIAASGKNATINVTISSTNYTDITATITVTTVNKSDAGVTISSVPTSKTYGDADFNLTASAANMGTGTGAWTWSSSDSSVLSVAGTGANATVTIRKAGSATISAKYESDTTMDTKTTASITINKKAATVAPKAVSITKGSTIPTFELVYTGLVSGESLTPSALPTFTCFEADGTTPVSTSTAAGTYTITWTNTGITFTGANNYDLTKTPTATLTISNPSYYGGGGGSYTPSYTVSVDKTENGTITVSPKSASKGDTVTVTVKPDKGYELDTLKVLDKNGDKVKLTEKNGKYTFTMPAGKVTVKGSFVEETPEQIFKDVPVDAYYYEAVKWAAEKGITGGVGNDLFAPNQPCTRAQIVTFLWRAAGSPAPKSMSSFADVPADAFYAKAVAWAVENGITGGTGDGKFSPDATCTRAQSVTFLYRAAGSPKVSSSAEFGDVATNAYYADAVAWAAKNGITGGIGGGLFGSDNDCTRAQIVTFLYRSVK